MLVLSCSWDAPHDNPLDPALGGNVEGRVMTRRATGIPGARVMVRDAGRFCETDSTGRFVLSGLPAESLEVRVEAAGYGADSVVLGFEKGRIDTLTRYLNGLPYFERSSVTSHVYGRSWPPEPMVFFRFVATVGDLDGDADIDSVWVEIPGIGFAERLDYNPEEKHFGRTLWASSLPEQRPETLVGEPVQFRVADIEGAVFDDPGSRVERLIYELPVPTFPSGGLDTIDTDTTFVWKRFDPGYAVGYHGEVVRIEGGGPAGVVLSFDTEEPGDTAFAAATAGLVTGDYYWTIASIDRFGNSSRSAEERFHAR